MRIEDMKNNIAHQTRHGRTQVYLKRCDYLQLKGIASTDETYEYYDANDVKQLLDEYENKFKAFKRSMKPVLLNPMQKTTRVTGDEKILGDD